MSHSCKKHCEECILETKITITNGKLEDEKVESAMNGFFSGLFLGAVIAAFVILI